MQSKARGKESLDEGRKQTTAHKSSPEFINPEDENPCESGLINSLEPFQRCFCSGSFSRYFLKPTQGLTSVQPDCVLPHASHRIDWDWINAWAVLYLGENSSLGGEVRSTSSLLC